MKWRPFSSIMCATTGSECGQILKPFEKVEDNIGLYIIKSCGHGFQRRPQWHLFHAVSQFQQGFLDGYHLFQDTGDGFLFPVNNPAVP